MLAAFCDRCGELKREIELKVVSAYLPGYGLVQKQICADCNNKLEEFLYPTRKGV